MGLYNNTWLRLRAPAYLYPDAQADLVIKSYANYKDQLGLGCYMLHITLSTLV